MSKYYQTHNQDCLPLTTFESSIALKTAEALENMACQAKKWTIDSVKSYIETQGNEAADKAA